MAKDPLQEILDDFDKQDPLDAIVAADKARLDEEPSGLSRFLGMANRAGASALGLISSPILDPLNRPQPGDPGYEEFAQRYAGQSFLERLDEALGRSRDAAVGGAKAAGFVQENLPPASTMLDRIAEGLPAAAVGTGVLQAGARAAAPYVAGATSAAGRAVANVTEEIARRPVTTSLIDIGASPGMTVAREVTAPRLEEAFPGTEHPVMAAIAKRTLGTAAEIVGGGVTAGLARLAFHPVVRWSGEAFREAPAAATPIIPRDASPEIAGNIARQHTGRVLDLFDRLVARAIQNVRPTTAAGPVTEEVASRALRGRLLVARDFMERSATRAYEEVPDDVVGNPRDYGDALHAMRDFAREFPGESPNFPTRLIDEHIRQLADELDADGNVVSWRQDVPLWELDRLRTVVRNEAWDAAEFSTTGSSSNRRQHANLEILGNILDQTMDQIGAAHPQYAPRIQYARELWRKYNDWFRRGPVGEMLITKRHTPLARPGQPQPTPGSSKIPPGKVGRELLKDNEEADAVHGAMQVAATATNNPIMGNIVARGVGQSADEAIRAMFHDDIYDHFMRNMSTAQKPAAAADIPTTYNLQRGPIDQTVNQAQAWINRNQARIASWANTTAGLVRTVGRMSRLLAARDEYAQSQVGQFLGRNPVDVIEAGLRSANPRAAFESMYRSLHGNPDFMEGIQRALFDALVRGEGADPNVAMARLQSPRFREAFSIMFRDDPAGLTRLHNALDNTIAITRDWVRAAGGRASVDEGRREAQRSRMRRVYEAGTSWAAGIAGLAIGNVAARVIPLMGSAGSLSIPMRANRYARDLVAASWVRNQRQALDFVRVAVFNPDAEAWLRNAAPGNFNDMRGQFIRATRITRRIEALMNEDVDAVLQGNSIEREAQERRRLREKEAAQTRNPFGASK